MRLGKRLNGVVIDCPTNRTTERPAGRFDERCTVPVEIRHLITRSLTRRSHALLCVAVCSALLCACLSFLLRLALSLAYHVCSLCALALFHPLMLSLSRLGLLSRRLSAMQSRELHARRQGARSVLGPWRRQEAVPTAEATGEAAEAAADQARTRTGTSARASTYAKRVRDESGD